MALELPRFIGVTGFMGSGKDSVGQVLVEQYGFKRYAFADQLKSMALALNPIVTKYPFPKHPERLATIVELFGWEKAKENEEVRRFLQVLGTEGVRDHLGEYAWIEALWKKITDDRAGSPIVITDVRFPNEADWVKDIGGVVWRVIRPGYGGNGHSSETEITKIVPSSTIVNDGGLGKLWVEVDQALRWEAARRD